ncbi:MAG: tRNA (N6-isopentenyl adenosine(37)-C2)-methylthiotransferase MiaB [Gemmatimonadota bacterium]|nr:tRNA (N6-isopentenyl adenosine(37)-C2)-methylthiotransferase MiaB [Gemmatimonadota bacterium]
MTKSTRSKRAYVETYGCQMNISDGELMEGILANSGFEIVEAPEDADVVLVNTCAIREHAENRVLGRVAQLNGLKRERPELVIGVTGCMAQRMGETLFERAPYVDLVMGPDGYRGLPDALENLEGYRVDRGTHSRIRSPQLAILDLSLGENYQGLEQRRTEGPTAWIPIQRGCNHRCTFCIVPYVRGPEKNRDPLEILNEVRDLTSRGVTEVTLLGQTVNSYTSMDVSFPKLLSEVAQVEGIQRVRFTSPHPNDVTPELIEVMATEPAVCEHLHLPAQSGNNRTLKRMLRRYSVEVLLEKVEMVRADIPEIAISTDIIVAFPGETDDEFRDTLELMRTVRFDEAFTYKYSPREGTPATRLPADEFVPTLEAQARLEELIEVSRGIQAEINAGEIGRIDEVLIERIGRYPGQILGRTRRNKVVAFDGDSERIGCYTHVGLERTTGATFAGKETGQPELVGQS